MRRPGTSSRAVQADGTCWAGGAFWQGRQAMRIAVSNWSTTEDDIDRSADAMLACYRASTRYGFLAGAFFAGAFFGAGPGVNSSITLLMVAIGRPGAVKLSVPSGRMTVSFSPSTDTWSTDGRRAARW